MLYTIPDYYKKFCCTADACEDTCCAGWQIVIDRKSLRKYKQVKGTFRKQIKKSVDWRQSIFRQDKDQRCAFLDEQNLCDLYKYLGQKSLCRTCRLYPRHIEEFEDVREITLSLSCPEVARLLMNRRDPVRFLSVEKEGEEEYQDYDPFLYSQLVDAREVMVTLLQDRTMPMDIRMQLILGMTHDMQHRIDRQELFSCQEVLGKYQKPAAKDFVRTKLEELTVEDRYDFSRQIFQILQKMERLKSDWDIQLIETEQRLYQNHDENQWENLTAAFAKWKESSMSLWEIQKEQLMVYFVFTYFCGAVYDGAAYGKIKMAAASVCLIEEMLKARLERNEGTLDTEDVMEIVYRYSREIEHSDKNLKELENLLNRVKFC